MAVLPKIQEFLDQLAIIKAKLAEIGFKQNQTNTREGLANLTRIYMTDFDSTVFAVDDVVLNGRYPIPIRIYIPDLSQPLPVAAFIHGGGHMCGSITVYDNIVRKLAKTTNHIIVSIDYRLAPEFPYPTGIEDSKVAIRGIFPILNERKIKYRDRKLTIIGDSGGAAVCASIVMDKEFVAIEQITKQVLIYPSLDYTLTSPSMDKLAEGFLLDKAKVAWYVENYLQNGEDRKSVSPLYGEFYSAMPATMVITAAYDPLHDEGVAYYNNVVNVGVNAELMQVDGVIHAYLMLENLCTEECNKTYQEINKFLNH